MTAALDISPEHEAIVRAVLADHLPGDVTVSVYGSRAKGKAHRSSDLDLALAGAGPIPAMVMLDLADAFDESDLPWKVDLIDWATTSERFRAIVAPDLRVLHPGGRAA